MYQALKCDSHITCMHAFPVKKGAAGDVFLLAFTDGSFGMCVQPFPQRIIVTLSTGTTSRGGRSGGLKTRTRAP